MNHYHRVNRKKEDITLQNIVFNMFTVQCFPARKNITYEQNILQCTGATLTSRFALEVH